MIGKVLRGKQVGGLLRYLFGPGKANEHTDPHLVASWDGDPAGLEPRRHPDTGRPDTRRLADLLGQPLSAAVRPPAEPVWHCAVRAAPGDRRLTDAEWRAVARDILDRTGLAPDGEDGGVRWVAVRHADDHIHLVATLARQDGAPVRLSNDYYRVGESCRAAETRHGLTRTAPRDRTAASRPTRGETEKAARAKRAEPARVALQREVRTAAAGAGSGEEFLARLSEAGLLVRQRHHPTQPGRVTGYAVALPRDRAADGRPVWFGGGTLAADLSWPKLAAGWRATGSAGHPCDAHDLHDVVDADQLSGPVAAEDQVAGHDRTAGGRRPDSDPATPQVVSGHRSWRGGRLTGADRLAAWRHATAVSGQAAAEVALLAVTDPAAAADIAHATGRMLAATARVVEGRAGGPLTRAADTYDRAAREVHGRIPARHDLGAGLRAVARLIALTGRAGRDETVQVLALITALTALADAVADLRHAQARAAQATAARQAAGQLRATTTPVPPPPEGRASPRRVAAAVIHRPQIRSVIHRSTPASPNPGADRRRLHP